MDEEMGKIDENSETKSENLEHLLYGKCFNYEFKIQKETTQSGKNRNFQENGGSTN